ncbi:MAG TPA: hypothetical protein VFQ78_14505 [Candidatus Udaeobacter sp.]|nr:hypothetical protein [Candidatus Udaeobacter sp.]
MNPDKLFDYLAGRLLPTERVALEKQLMSDKQLQRELAVARQIYAGMHGDSREVLPLPDDVSVQGRSMAIRIGAAFMVLVFVNVGIGLWFIFRHESNNPNRPLLERQMREQIEKSIERAAATLTPQPNALGITEITVSVESGKVESVADQLIKTSSRLGGSATKGLEDHGRLTILINVPANREAEFRAVIGAIGGVTPEPSVFGEATAGKVAPATTEKKSFIVQIVQKQ